MAPARSTGSDPGVVYLFDAASGATLLTLQAPTPSNADRFGASIAVLGGDVLVGAPGSDDAGPDAGAAYLFDGTTGALLQTFVDPAPATDDGFGSSVAAAAGNVLVGSPHKDAPASDNGVAYLFDPSTGAVIRSFSAPTCLRPGR